MTIAQGINKIVSFKFQSALGTPAIGAGGQILRRRTSVPDAKRATFVNDEIVDHQQSTGVNLATASSDWAFDGLLSPGTYSKLIQALLRRDFTAGVAITGLSLTVSVSGSNVTLTRAAGDFLTGGIKIGDVVRITAGTYSNAVNRDNNLLLTAVTATTLVGRTLNKSTMIAEGPIASSTVTVIGKKTMPPLTGHTDQLFTLEEWYPDITNSELYPDLRVGQMDIALPASGNAGIKLNAMGLGVRTLNTAQQMTSPTSATTSPVLTAVRGLAVVGGSVVVNLTGAQLSVKGNLAPEGPVMGSDYSPDMSRGRIQVSGSFTALFDATTFIAAFDAGTPVSLVFALAASAANAADFVIFNVSPSKIVTTTPDDGEKAVSRSYSFEGEINGSGGTSLANDKTIITIQDSLA